jgi:hypothetical protein
MKQQLTGMDVEGIGRDLPEGTISTDVWKGPRKNTGNLSQGN